MNTFDVSRPAGSRFVPRHQTQLNHSYENKKFPPFGFLQLANPCRIFPVPRRRDAHAVRSRRRATASEQHTDDWFVPLVDTAGNYARDTVTDTALRRRWSN